MVDFGGAVEEALAVFVGDRLVGGIARAAVARIHVAPRRSGGAGGGRERGGPGEDGAARGQAADQIVHRSLPFESRAPSELTL